MEVPIIALVRDGRRARAIQPGDEIEVVLPATPFYVEAGGQVSDTGFITGGGTQRQQPDWRVRVTDIRQPVPGLVIHVGQVVEGQPREGDLAWALVDVERRMDIMRNHTATHLLHRGLRQVLGSHVQQAGSLVAPDRLRFDFTHDAMLTREQLDEITHAVNDVILRNYPLHISHESYAQALEGGVVALFGEKYGDVVRVVRIGGTDEIVSQELCGGTHVRETGDIGQFHIVSEGSVGAGLRRIEAVAGRVAERLVSDRLGVLETAAAHLECQPEEVDQKVLALIEQSHSAQKEINRLRQELAHRDFERLLSHIRDLDGAAFLAARVKASQVETLREITDWFRDRYPSSVIVLGAVIDQRPQLVAAVTPDLVEKGVRANELIKRAAQVIGGGGGGRPTLAQAGGRDVDRLDEALSGVLGLVQKALGDGE